MKKQPWKTYLLWILGTEAVGVAAGLLSRGATQAYGETIRTPAFAPPAILFPIVWTLLYALMGFGAARVDLSPPCAARRSALRVYGLQLFFNFFWTLIFFNLQAFGAAFLWLVALWGLILWMLLLFRKVDPLAGWLQLPYLLWVTFAGYLNLSVWLLNR